MYDDIRGSLKTAARLLMNFRRLKKVNDVRAKYLVMCENFYIILKAALNLAGLQVLRKIKKTSRIYQNWTTLKIRSSNY